MDPVPRPFIRLPDVILEWLLPMLHARGCRIRAGENTIMQAGYPWSMLYVPGDADEAERARTIEVLNACIQTFDPEGKA